MKQTCSILLIVCLGCFLAACGGGDDSGDADVTTNSTNTVDAVTEPMADITMTGGPTDDDAPAPQPSVPRSGVLAIGDSITNGYRAESWANKLARFRGVQVFRSGINGNRAGNVAGRIASELDNTNAAMVLILVGTNDSRSNSTGGDAFGRILDTAIGRGVTPLIGTIPPEFESLEPEPEPEPEPDPEPDPDPDPDPTDPDPDPTDPTDPDPDPIDPNPEDPPEGSNTASRVSFALAKNTARVNAVNANLRAAAGARGVRVVEVHAAFANNRALLQDDGFHPNDAGQNVIAVKFGEAF